MSKKLLVIKLGGAVVTYKNSPTPKARIQTIKSLSKEIKQLKDQGYQIVLVHGAGSFAHGIVKKYDLHHGMKTEQQRRAFKLTQKRMLKLNKIIMDELTLAGLNSVSLSPHTFITQNEGKLHDFDLKLIKKYLAKNITPMLFGDMVLDDKWGCSVLSGDTIVCYLGKKLKAEKVIFLSDVDGIYDKDPKKYVQARLIPEITNKNIVQVLKGLSPTEREDVTGEMQGKVLKIYQELKQVETFVVNGKSPKVLTHLMNSIPTGTKLLFR